MTANTFPSILPIILGKHLLYNSNSLVKPADINQAVPLIHISLFFRPFKLKMAEDTLKITDCLKVRLNLYILVSLFLDNTSETFKYLYLFH